MNSFVRSSSVHFLPSFSLLVFLLFLLPGLSLSPAYAGGAKADRETTELWTGSILTASYRAGVCTKKDGSARGVLYLTHANGQTDVYHVYGHKKGNYFELRHESGHTGQITEAGDGSLTGTVRIKNKYKVSVKGRSQLNVKLSDDCAPLR